MWRDGRMQGVHTMYSAASGGGVKVPPQNMAGIDGEVLMQYTGLKDATKWEQLSEAECDAWTRSGKTPLEWSGREIYEGDIIRTEKGPAHIVEFEKGQYVARCVNNNWRWALLTVVLTMTVVGNIYENPELITPSTATV
ncbi:hypothetical protein GCM10023184_18090 [Flaviaesturariibacter amylovorans]|uniref:YopX protein domain-containing protein n=2 Tax=Flaviaesturariibacter amylovorans TaxID=1084520 RepID=A0ABP8GQ45_9BACT